MDGLNRATILYLLFIAVYANVACLQESLTSESTGIADSLPTDESRVDHTPGATANSRASAVNSTELSNANCRVGQVLAPEDTCTYPGKSDEFRVDAGGKGHFLFFAATAIINAQNANINGQNYDFSARKQDDGNWIIELVGTSVDAIRVSDLIAPDDNSMPSTASAEPPVTQDEGIRSASSPSDSDMPESTSIPPSSIAETAPSSEQVSASESPLYSPVATPTPEFPSVQEPASTISVGASSADATASKREVLTPRQNRSPQIVGNVEDRTVTVGESIVVNISRVFSDADGDELEQYIVILSNTTVASGTADSSVGSLTLTGLQIGSSWVAVQACDHSGCSVPGDLTFQLTVEPPLNRPPQAVNHIEDQQVIVGKTRSVYMHSAFRDFEGDRIVRYEVKLQDEGLAKVTAKPTGTFNFTGLRTGVTTALVRACDYESCGDDNSTLSFGLEVVAPPNSPPAVIGSVGDQSVLVGELIQLNMSSYFADPDGDEIQEYQLSQAEDGIADGAIDSNKGILSLRGVAVGNTSITVSASDGDSKGETSSLTFNLEVTEPQPNIPQVVGVVHDQTVELGDSVEVAIAHAFDAPSRYRIIRYDFLVNDRELAVDSEITRNGVLTLRGSAVGKSWVSARACSRLGCSNFSDLSFVLVVTDSERRVNRRPEVVGGVFSRSLRIGESFTMDVSRAFSDPDGDSIVDYKYIIGDTAVAAGSSITNTGVLVLYGSEPGTTTIAVIACDDEGECSDPDNMKFALTVEAR